MSIKINDLRNKSKVRKYLYYLQSIIELITQFIPLKNIISLFTGLKNVGPCVVTLRKKRLSFKVRSAMDVWSIKETFIDRFYEKYGCPVSDGWVVMDIGGGIGDFAVFASHDFPTNQVFTFEPYPGSYELLVSNLTRNRITNVRALQKAVWSGNGRLALDTSTGEPIQFISREVDFSTVNGSIGVPCVSLQDAMELLGIQQCDLLKIDAEGAEYVILFHAAEPLFEKIDRIVMEFHDAIYPYTHADLTNFLLKKGYQVKVVDNPVHPELGYLYAVRKNALQFGDYPMT